MERSTSPMPVFDNQIIYVQMMHQFVGTCPKFGQLIQVVRFAVGDGFFIEK
jgi:hypothetical protein